MEILITFFLITSNIAFMVREHSPYGLLKFVEIGFWSFEILWFAL